MHIQYGRFQNNSKTSHPSKILEQLLLKAYPLIQAENSGMPYPIQGSKLKSFVKDFLGAPSELDLGVELMNYLTLLFGKGLPSLKDIISERHLASQHSQSHNTN